MGSRVFQFGICLWYVRLKYFIFKWKLHLWHYFWWFTSWFIMESSKICTFSSPYWFTSLSFDTIYCACAEILALEFLRTERTFYTKEEGSKQEHVRKYLVVPRWMLSIIIIYSNYQKYHKFIHCINEFTN